MSKIDFRKLALRMKAARALAGISIQQLEKQCGLSSNMIHKIEKNRVTPKEDKIVAIINALALENVGISKEWILFGDASRGTIWQTTDSQLPSLLN